MDTMRRIALVHGAAALAGAMARDAPRPTDEPVVIAIDPAIDSMPMRPRRQETHLGVRSGSKPVPGGGARERARHAARVSEQQQE